MSDTLFKPCIVIPVYHHEKALQQLLPKLQCYGLAIFLIDDGSRESCKSALQTLAATSDNIHLHRLAENRGKGGAVKAGLQLALSFGYTHALQMDADGQHNSDDIGNFLADGQARPQHLICGYPDYDDSVPALRFYARYLTHVWVWINTLSLTIKDSMCGFRLYPLSSVMAIINTEPLGDRMDFDTAILVRWYWRNLPITQRATKVHYPTDGISHFLALKDNLLISKMHASLFFGMLWRLPRLLANKIKR